MSLFLDHSRQRLAALVLVLGTAISTNAFADEADATLAAESGSAAESVSAAESGPAAEAATGAAEASPASAVATRTESSTAVETALASDEKRPPSGLAPLIAGWALSAIGALNLVTLPLCFLDVYPESAREGCKIGSIAIAGVGLGVGIPLLFVGSVEHDKYKAWKSRSVAQTLGQLQISVRRDQAFVVYRGAF